MGRKREGEGRGEEGRGELPPIGESGYANLANYYYYTVSQKSTPQSLDHNFTKIDRLSKLFH